MTSFALLSQRVKESVGRTFEKKVNCFCISEFFYLETQFRHSSADEMLDFVANNFRQTKEDGPNVLTLIWSRSSLELPIGQIQVHELAKRQVGFPFGLILEHSFVQIDETTVFQKADPTKVSKIEITPLTKALNPYLHLKGFELTRHASTTQF